MCCVSATETGVLPIASLLGIIETRFIASVFVPIGLSRLSTSESPLS